ncbi:MAG: alpha/beta hydrolase [Bacteroidetes bacterium]|nr:alpha/beta hydrolase [Bacteroidota bacterium]
MNTIWNNLLVLILANFLLTWNLSVFGQEQDSCIWIITNRTINPPDEPGMFFGSKVDPQGRLRFVKGCKCPMERWNYQLRSDLNDLLQDMPSGKDIVVFVHGDYKAFDEAADRGLEIENTYDVNVLLFTWPSRLPESFGTKNFKNSQNNVRLSAGQFYNMLELIQEYKTAPDSPWKNSRLTMFHHSLGNYFLERVATDSSITINLQPGLFDNLVLNAAAVNAEGHEKWLEKINFARNIYVTSNKMDFNLNGVRFFTNDGKQLGERIYPPLAGNAIYINFTETVGFRTPTGASHTYFLGEIMEEIPNLREFYNTIFHGEQPDLSDTTLFRVNTEGLGYDLIR